MSRSLLSTAGGRCYDSRCMVCNGSMKPFFSKTFDRWDVGTLDYEKCAGCGFVACASLLRLSDEDWSALNHRFHSTIYDGSDPFNRAGRLAGQARAIDAMLSVGLIDSNKPMLDGARVSATSPPSLSRAGVLCSATTNTSPLWSTAGRNRSRHVVASP